MKNLRAEILVLLLLGCTNPNKPVSVAEPLLECMLRVLTEEHDTEKGMKIIISEFEDWTDSTTYISVWLDTDNLHEPTGEFWIACYNGYKIYHYSTAADTTVTKRMDALTTTMPNRLKWDSRSVIQNLKVEGISPPYDPPKIDFIYHPANKCVVEYLPQGAFKEKLSLQCKRCN